MNLKTNSRETDESLSFKAIFILSVSIGVVAALIPSALAHNIGYVDPNFYIGYAKQLRWLTSAGGYEYHATRLPLLGLINILLRTGVGLFGLAYKFSIEFLVILSWLFMCRNVGLSRNSAIGGASLIAVSPLVVSAASWTMPNGFAMVIALPMWSLVTARKESWAQYFSLGFLFTIVFNLNAFVAVFNGIGLLVFLAINFRKRIATSVIPFLIGVLSSGVVFEAIWHYLLRISGFMWSQHFKVLLDTKNVSSENWVPIGTLITSPSSVVSIASFVGVGLICPTLLMRFKANTQKSNWMSPLGMAVLGMTGFAFVTYFLKINFGFSSFWYFYTNGSVYLLALLFAYLTIGNEHARLLSLACVTASVVLILRNYGSSSWLSISKINTLLVLTTIVFLVAINKILITYKLSFRDFRVLSILAIFSISWLALYIIPAFVTSYSPVSNAISRSLLDDEIQALRLVSTLPPIKGDIATWSGSDPTGGTGSLISALSFHLLRLEGISADTATPDTRTWASKYGHNPKYIVALTSVADPNFKSELNLCDYDIVNSNLLKSKLQRVTILKVRVEANTAGNCKQ